MFIKKLIISTAWASIAWASIVMANEIPPDLPFEALDGTSLTPYQDGNATNTGDMDMTNQAPSPQNEMNGQVVNGNASNARSKPATKNGTTETERTCATGTRCSAKTKTETKEKTQSS